MKTKIFSILAVLAILIMALPGSVMADSVPMTTTVEAASPVLLYHLLQEGGGSLTGISFGTLTVGNSSVAHFYVQNDSTSTSSIRVDITPANTGSWTMYTNRMKISFNGNFAGTEGVDWWSWTGTWYIPSIAVGASQIVYLQVTPISPDDIGTPEGTLSFSAMLL